MIIDEFTRGDWELDGYRSGKEEEFERTHPACSECGCFMLPQSERYNLGEPYVDEWFECPDCGHCISN